MNEQGPKIVGSRTCPECGRRFARLDPGRERSVRRDCTCGKRWMIRFVDGDPRLAERLGTAVVRLSIEPYEDGRRKRSTDPSGQLALPFLRVAEEEPAESAEPAAPARARRRSVARGARYAKR